MQLIVHQRLLNYQQIPKSEFKQLTRQIRSRLLESANGAAHTRQQFSPFDLLYNTASRICLAQQIVTDLDGVEYHFFFTWLNKNGHLPAQIDVILERLK